ncbi:MAG: dTDP-4-dehydrorhamnose reductase [Gammaproteobacteria bacterium RIFCSPHIGHO2_12_FULL_42_13]|nr:MAG: dTDP-4-dehydrorhamnose reductase [Gammaproteobacteria bacterium RIFCSPHIGHO2_12_FULL_42_13]
MRIFITGAHGQIGREICELAKSHHEVFAFTRAQLDINHPDKINQSLSSCTPDVVINAAAYTAVDKAEQAYELAFAINRDGVINLALACKQYQIPLLHISTDYIFDGTKASPYLETDLASPVNIYGQSKWQGEVALREYYEQHIILRTSWVFGQYGQNFVKTILRLAKEKKELRIVTDQVGCPTSAAAIAQTLLDIAQQIQYGKKLWGTYHYCSSHPVSWFEFAQEIIQQAQPYLPLITEALTPITSKDYPTPAIRPQHSVLDTNKLKSAYNVDPCDWQEELTTVIAQHFNHANLG